MEILSWTLGSDVSVQALKTLIEQKRPYVMFLYKTKSRDKDYMCSLRFRLGYLNCEAVLSEVNLEV